MKPEKPEQNSNQKTEGESKMSQKIIELFPEDIIVDFKENGRWGKGQELNQSVIEDRARSIETEGQLQPVGVRKVPGKNPEDDFEYKLIFGFNRYRAVELLNKLHPKDPKKLQCKVIDTEDSKVDPFLKNVEENKQRKDLSIMDLSHICRKLRTEFGWKDVAISKRLEMSAAYVTKLKALEHIPLEAQLKAHEGRLTLDQAEALAKLQDDPEHQMKVFKNAEKEMLAEAERNTLGATLSNDGVADPTTTKQRKKREPKLNITASAQKLQGENTEPSPRKMNEFRGILSEWEEEGETNLAYLATILLKILNGAALKGQVKNLRSLLGDEVKPTTPSKGNGRRKKDLVEV